MWWRKKEALWQLGAQPLGAICTPQDPQILQRLADPHLPTVATGKSAPLKVTAATSTEPWSFVSILAARQADSEETE